jgi:hypothetical protein
MKFATLLACVPLIAGAAAWAAPPKYNFVDKSSPVLMDEATALAVFGEIATARLAKLYPASRWGFATQVVGGFTSTNTCVVTARVMLLPRNNPRPTELLLFKPERMATTFDALPDANQESCRALAKAKLHEAMQAIASGIVH